MGAVFLFLQKLLSFLFKFFVKLLIILFHDALNCHGGGYDVAESGHPHVSLVERLGTEYENPAIGLHVEWVLPVFRQDRFANRSLGQIAVRDVSERDEFGVLQNLIRSFGAFLVPRIHLCGLYNVHGSIKHITIIRNNNRCLGKIDHKIPLRMHSPLKYLDIFDELFQVPLHFITKELNSFCLSSVPGPQLFVSFLNNLLVTCGLRKLLL